MYKAFSLLESRLALVSRLSLVSRFGQEFRLGRNLVEEIGTGLEHALQSLTGGIDEVSSLAAERESPGDLAVSSGGDKFCGRGDEAVGSQRGRLLGDPLLGRQIRHAADEEIGGFLAELLGRLIFEDPLAILID